MQRASASRSGTQEILDIVNEACKTLSPGDYAEACDRALHAAIASGDDERFDRLLQVDSVRGNVEHVDGWTPLHFITCYDENRDVMRTKLEQKLQRSGQSVEGVQASSATTKEPRTWHRNDIHAALLQTDEERTDPMTVRVVEPLLRPPGISMHDTRLIPFYRTLGIGWCDHDG
ncbi:hypothetical protein S40288_10974 [Stachybotrys chartarum IBT 40288]|nr:hypothetical protein S40288_10974 [Stachybotrys chartarum IBT 40288]